MCRFWFDTIKYLWWLLSELFQLQTFSSYMINLLFTEYLKNTTHN